MSRSGDKSFSLQFFFFFFEKNNFVEKIFSRVPTKFQIVKFHFHSQILKTFIPQKMINLLQETKKKIRNKNLLSRFPNFDRRSVFSAALYRELASEANQFIPVENILKSEANIGLLGQEDECECLSGFFFMRAHGVIHDACGRAYHDLGVGKGYCYAVENSTAFMKSSPFLGHISGIAFCI